MEGDVPALRTTALAGKALRPPRRPAGRSLREATMKGNKDDLWPSDAGSCEERVGYGKPPRRTRFRPGRSGNPKGRPKGAEGLKTIVKHVADEKHRVVEQGKVRWRTNLELVLMTVRACALKGDAKAFQLWHELLIQYGAEEP